MEEVAIVVWVLVLVVIFAILCYAGVGWWTNLTLSLFISWLFLAGIYLSCRWGTDCCPFGCRKDHQHRSKHGRDDGRSPALDGFFGVITVITFLVFLAYVISQAIWGSYYVPLAVVTKVCVEDSGRMHKISESHGAANQGDMANNPHEYY